MKALTLTQPWATLVILGVKHWETRGWYPSASLIKSIGGRIAIHAAKGWTADDRDFALDLMDGGLLPHAYVATTRSVRPDLPLGAVLGEATIVGLVRADVAVRAGEVAGLEIELGDYSPGRYAWELAGVIAYPEPIPARGALGLWDWEYPR